MYLFITEKREKFEKSGRYPIFDDDISLMIATVHQIYMYLGIHTKHSYLSDVYNEQKPIESMVIFSYCFYYHANQPD